MAINGQKEGWGGNEASGTENSPRGGHVMEGINDKRITAVVLSGMRGRGSMPTTEFGASSL